MKSTKRDLLVLSKKSSFDQKEMEQEVEKLHELLYHAESIENFCNANEIIEINKYKIIRKPAKVKRIISQRVIRPFQFIHNKN